MIDQERFPNPTEIRHRIGPEGSFSLHNISGDIRLRGTDTDEAVVNARSSHGRDDSLPLIVRRGEGSLHVEIEQRSGIFFGFGSSHRYDIEFDVTLPRGARVEINGVSADIDARGLVGEQEYKTVSGDLSLEATGGRLALSTVSGDARVVAEQPIEVRANTTSGDIEVDAPQIRGLQLRSVSGDAELRAAFDPASSHTVETVSGDVSIASASGLTVDVKRGMGLSGNGGKQRVVGDGAARLRFRSLSGDLQVSGAASVAHAFPAPPAPPMPPTPPTPGTPPAPEQQAQQPAQQPAVTSLDILRALERGEIDVEEAQRRLEGATSNA